jgi:hypothetical protein
MRAANSLFRPALGATSRWIVRGETWSIAATCFGVSHSSPE